MKETIESLKKENESLNSTIRNNAISKYKESCKVKGLVAKDLSNANMEMIQFAIEMVDEIPEAEEAEPVAEEEEKSESKEAEEVEDKEEETKPEAETQTVEAEEESEEEDALEGYTVTAEGCSKGFAFFKHY